jgi:CRISPR/Cas system CMR-associated protein Cmr5 small subunit
MIASELLLKIEKFKELIQKLDEANDIGKFLWQLKTEIEAYFKATQFVSVEAKETTRAYFDNLCNELKEKQEAIKNDHIEFANQADAIIEELAIYKTNQFFQNKPEKEAALQLKALIDKAFGFFKNPHWPSKERRNSAWDKFSALRTELKNEEDAYYAQLKEERNLRIATSKKIIDKLIEIVHVCNPETGIEQLPLLLDSFGAILVNLPFEANGMELPNNLLEALMKNALKSKSDIIREAKKFVNNHRVHLVWDDIQRLYTEIDIINELLNKAWALHREEIQKKQEEWEERKKLNAQKREDWVKKQEDYLQVLNERLEKRTNDKLNLEKIVEGKIDYLKRQEIRKENQSQFLEKSKADLDEMTEQLKTAWSESFIERTSQKIEQKKAKIAEVLSEIESLKVKSLGIENDIQEINVKIGILEKGLEETVAKIEEVKKNLASE